ncbi:ABC transporter permease [Pandoraea terrae]|uniref:ABC transporter permease n=1 Tax=Pandoraea terrae TaxID=1537710 RepID=A0A5E4ZC26_9BURK|nr:ABC transporter permease [Pandoraea terrae]VVE58162.1 ABC transporter permease [Pandoraea terrae]
MSTAANSHAPAASGKPDAGVQSAARRQRAAGWALVAPATLYFLLLLAVPLVLTFVLSLNGFDPNLGGILAAKSLHNYADILTDAYFYAIFLRTLLLSLGVTLLCVLIGVPEAYFLFRMRDPWRSLCLVLVLGPLLISVVVRTLGWSILLGREGLINLVLTKLGIVEHPLQMMFTMGAVTLAMVHVLVPLLVLSVWTSLTRLDASVAHAARSLGAGRFTVMWRVVLPQITPGILSGSLIVFALTASAFATPALIGGRRLKVVATTAYDEFLGTLNWPLGAAIAVVLLILNVAIITGYNRAVEKRITRRLG